MGHAHWHLFIANTPLIASCCVQVAICAWCMPWQSGCPSCTIAQCSRSGTAARAWLCALPALSTEVCAHLSLSLRLSQQCALLLSVQLRRVPASQAPVHSARNPLLSTAQ